MDDSPTVGMYLEWIFNQEAGMEVIGRVTNGKEAVNFVKRDKPDVITMDIEMPVMNGLEATRIIMENNPVPIVIVTASRNARETKMTMDALAAGALTLIEKPRGMQTMGSNQSAQAMITTTRIMAGVKVVTRKMKPAKLPVPKIMPEITVNLRRKAVVLTDIRLIAIGVSTGGPAVLKEILSGLDTNFPLPIVVVQHIASGFIDGMIDWLNGELEIAVIAGKDGKKAEAGTVYFAPDGQHLTIDGMGKMRMERNNGDYICPSVAHLFGSLKDSFGKYAMAIILTGMGDDGAREMKMLYDLGAITIAQDKETSLIYGMPGEAVKLKGVTHSLRTSEIGSLLKKIELDHNRQKLN